jgi:chromate transporter
MSSDDIENGATLRPSSPGQMFHVFTRLALQGFGGVLSVSHRELVERQRWLSPDDFLRILSVSQVLPGPNIINMALIIGWRFFGWRGALASTLGMLCVPLVLVMSLVLLYAQFSAIPAVAGALRGMGVVSAGLIAATAWRVMGGLRKNPMGQLACASLMVAAFLGVGWLRWPMVWVVLGLGSVGVSLAWWRLAKAAP